MKRSRNFKDITGLRFGHWTVISYAGRNKNGFTLWLCQCDCGTKKEVCGYTLRDGSSQSCGCSRNERLKNSGWHGESHIHPNGKGTKEYQAWKGMIERCTVMKPKNKYYCGRGISVCKKWLNSYPAFLADVGRAPTSSHSLDRIDVNGNYEPGNVRWATPFQQVHNRRIISKNIGILSGLLSFGN